MNELITLTRGEWKLRQQNTLLGFLLTLLNPLLVFLAVYAVFASLFSSSRPDYALFLLIGLLQWNFFSLATSYGLGSLLRRSNLVKNYPFEPAKIVVSSVAAVFLSHLAENLILVLIVSFHAGSFSPVFLLVFLLDLILLAFAASIAVITAALNVFYYDTERLWGIFLTGLFFLTPVFYPKEAVNTSAYPFLKYNILGSFMDLYRAALLGGNPSARDLALLASVSCAFFLLALFFCKKLKPGIQDSL